jgi:hypothetical protein
MTPDLIGLYKLLFDNWSITSCREEENTYIIRVVSESRYRKEAYRFILDEAVVRAIKEREIFY